MVWPCDHSPVPKSETSTIGRLTGALPVVERAHDPTGDGHRADRVAEARAGRSGHVVLVGSLDPHGDAGPSPEGQRVVAPFVCVGTSLALAAAPARR